jgi:hypothetical protein
MVRVVLRSRLTSGLARSAVSIAVMATALVVTVALSEAVPAAPSAVVFAAALVIAWIAGLAPAVVTTLGRGAIFIVELPLHPGTLSSRRQHVAGTDTLSSRTSTGEA